MGLFDNIFLDKDTPTAMLDPLLTDEQKKANAEAREQEKAKKNVSTPESVGTSDDKNELSDAQVTEIFDGPSAQGTTPLDTLTTLSPELNTSLPDSALDDISFDIGGIDLPTFESGVDATVSTDATVSGGFLSGNPAPTVEMINEMTPPAPLDASIAMVQGATSGASETIIDTVVPVTELSLSDTTPPSDTDGTPEMTLSITSDITETDTHPQEQKTETTNPNENLGAGLLDMLEDTPDTLNIVDAPTTEVLADSTEDIPLPSTDERVLDTSEITREKNMPVPSSFLPSSDLETMLAGFITQLEEFKKNSIKTNTEMDELEVTLEQEMDELEDEYMTRKKAIEYRRKHIVDTRTEQSTEQERLEKIITSLQAELAH